jgi:hypothetical protein
MTANGERLIANDVHSQASATALQCATSIFLIANEFHLQNANLRRIFPRRLKRRRRAMRDAGGGKPRPYGRQEERHTAERTRRDPSAPLKTAEPQDDKRRSAEDVFDLVEETRAALDGLVFDFDDAVQLLEEGFLLLAQL